MIQAPLIVGYKGEVGRYCLACFLEYMPKANDILCVDINNSETEVMERIEKADAIFLCVPLQHTHEWLTRYLPAIGNRLVVEQSSLKGFLYEEPAFANLRFLSMHLLFRPSMTPLEDRRGLIFADRLDARWVAEFCGYAAKLFKTEMELLSSDSEPVYVVHDRLMAREQALVHRVLLCLADGLDDIKMRTFVGQRVFELAKRIRAGDPVLYKMIQENPYLDEQITSFQEKLKAFKV